MTWNGLDGSYQGGGSNDRSDNVVCIEYLINVVRKILALVITLSIEVGSKFRTMNCIAMILTNEKAMHRINAKVQSSQCRRPNQGT
jgi:hypothetical protein